MSSDRKYKILQIRMKALKLLMLKTQHRWVSWQTMRSRELRKHVRMNFLTQLFKPIRSRFRKGASLSTLKSSLEWYISTSRHVATGRHQAGVVWCHAEGLAARALEAAAAQVALFTPSSAHLEDWLRHSPDHTSELKIPLFKLNSTVFTDILYSHIKQTDMLCLSLKPSTAVVVTVVMSCVTNLRL